MIRMLILLTPWRSNSLPEIPILYAICLPTIADHATFHGRFPASTPHSFLMIAASTSRHLLLEGNFGWWVMIEAVNAPLGICDIYGYIVLLSHIVRTLRSVFRFSPILPFVILINENSAVIPRDIDLLLSSGLSSLKLSRIIDYLDYQVRWYSWCWSNILSSYRKRLYLRGEPPKAPI